MKVLFVVLIVAAVSQAGKIDWDILRFGNNERVINGAEATPHQFPYQAGLFLSLADGRRALCGGSLITPNTILTAAHCFEGMVSVEVVLGAHKVFEVEPTQVRLVSTDWIVHPNWNPSTFNGDIAIIKLPQSVELNENIQLIKLPSRSDVGESFRADTATVSGWGRISDGSSANSQVLKFTSNPVMANFLCWLKFPTLVTSRNICVSSEGNTNPCNGDSGGPLTITDDNGVKQVGLVSFGSKAGCEVGYPGVYTRLTSYLDWIAENGGVTIE